MKRTLWLIIGMLFGTSAFVSAANSQAKITGLSAGVDFGLALKSDGSVLSWGTNYAGELANGSYTSQFTPAPTINLVGAMSVTAGAYQGLAVKSDHSLWAWGDDHEGELGIGNLFYQPSPVQVTGLSAGAIAASANWYHSLAVQTDGTVWAWGSNGYGEGGVNCGANATSCAAPSQIPGLSNFTGVAAGLSHNLALKSDGTVWAWGDNGNGELGDGSVTSSDGPVQASGLSGVTAIAAGFSSSIALKSDGTVWAWGTGLLGNANLVESHVPVQVTGLSGVVAIAETFIHALALKSDGTLWAWGYNGDGELGVGNTVPSNVPVQVAISGVTAIAAGNSDSLAAKSDGSVWAWGDNSSGQLGTGNLISTGVPVQVIAGSPGGPGGTNAGASFQISVFPNPWRSDKHGNSLITFLSSNANTRIKLFTLSGHWVKNLPATDSTVTWNLTNDAGTKVASGFYYYVATNGAGQTTHGEFAIIK